MRPDLDPEVLLQARSAPCHVLSVSKDDLRLVSCRCERIDFCATLAICREHIEANRRGQCRFAVAARNFDVNPPESTIAALVYPSKDRRQDKALPRL
jgi:hypothetical protein